MKCTGGRVVRFLICLQVVRPSSVISADIWTSGFFVALVARTNECVARHDHLRRPSKIWHFTDEVIRCSRSMTGWGGLTGSKYPSACTGDVGAVRLETNIVSSVPVMLGVIAINSINTSLHLNLKGRSES
ncbi:hypothetical protein Pla52o_23910 [Novipirellula galeiformis]|uniref:Uncharacterized protein n=1 Tax=Novipirellula galeiformis TaxID=2528004 RepID=A0A5C6CFF3_9BACT|nr:hypothetical protein Pla52o_23910 [Novipirellula galeiformis]